MNYTIEFKSHHKCKLCLSHSYNPKTSLSLQKDCNFKELISERKFSEKVRA